MLCEIFICIFVNTWWKIIDIWETESSQYSISTITYMPAPILLVKLFTSRSCNIFSWIAFDWVVCCDWALVNANSSRLNSVVLNNVIQVWISFKLVVAAKIAITINWCKKLAGFAVLSCVSVSVKIPTRKYEEDENEQNIGTAPILQWTVFQVLVG